MPSKNITLAPGRSGVVDFSFTPTAARVHYVSVNGLTGSFRVMEAVGPGYHTIPLNAASNEVAYDGASGDVAALTANIVGLLGVYHDDNGVWKYYIPGFATQTLTTLEYGKTYVIAVTSYPQDWVVPDHIAGPPGEGTYTVAVYYAYLDGSGPGPAAKWQEKTRYYVEYELKLITDYIKQQGVAAETQIMALELVELPEANMSDYKIKKRIKDRTSYTGNDLHIVVGEWTTGILAHASSGIAYVSYNTLDKEVKAMEGIAHPNDCFCELAHELGHIFNLLHCGTKPCPMASYTVTYNEWIQMGRTLYFCSYHRPQLLANWQNRNFDQR